MKIKIVFPEKEDWTGRERNIAQARVVSTAILSLQYLAGLAPSNVDIELIDMMYGDVPGYKNQADLVAIHVRTPVATTAFGIADEFRRRGVKVVMGGPHPTLLPEECKGHSDAVCIGEGERAWPAMIEDFARGDLRDYYVGGPHAVRHLNGRIREFPWSDMRNLPMPRRDLFPSGRYRSQGVLLSRGCPYGCKFCSVKNLQGAEVRLRPIEEVLKEISEIQGPIFFAEENATGILATADYHLKLFRRMAATGKKRDWSGGSTLGMASKEKGIKVLEAAVDSGFCFAFIGFESLSQVSARNAGVLGKLGQSHIETFDWKQLEKLVRVYYDLGIYIMGYFIIGFDEDREETYERIMDFCDETLVIPMFTMLAPMPGTQLYQEYRDQRRFREGIKWDDFGADIPTFHHPYFSASELNQRYRDLWDQSFTSDRIEDRLRFVSKRFPGVSDIARKVQISVRDAFNIKA